MYIDSRLDRPGVVFAELTRQRVFAELGARLVDADKLELAGPFVLGSRGIASWRRQGRPSSGGTEKDVEELHDGLAAQT